MPSLTIQSLTVVVSGVNEGNAAIELPGSDCETCGHPSAAVATITTADLDGWAIRQKETLRRERNGGCSPFARDCVWKTADDRPWYQVPGHSLSGLPLSSGKTFEGTDYE